MRGLATLAISAAPVPTLWTTCSRTVQAARLGVPVRPADALAAVLAATAVAGLAWLALGVLLALLALLPGSVGRAVRRLGAAVTPRVLRHGVGALLGVVVVVGAAPGSSAATPAPSVAAPAPLPDPGFTPLPDPGWAPPGVSPSPVQGWVPERPVVRAHPDVRVLSPAARSDPDGASAHEVVVRRGDSLWSIAARHLGRDATDAEIARAWPAWFEANRAVIGDNPDMLRPGQLLRPPGVVAS